MADMIPMGKLLAAAKKEYPNLDKEELTALIGLQIEARQAEANALMKRSNKGGYKLGRAEGGNISNQMEMFDDGGLKDEGNTIDPISGNDVPPGSTQEEVRDDIPAQLSEGEFVFPADVVRYLGLEKLMTLRQEAKMGLKTMEDMGQMGNSEEATIPDDMPFDINDLDMDDEQEYNSEDRDMAQGGVVYAANGFAGTTTNTNQLGSKASSFGNTATRVQPKTYTPPPIPPSAPAGGFQYGSQAADKKGKLDFGSLFKDAGGADEYRTYVNDAGAEIQVPFKNGKVMTGFTIPEGYKLKTDKVDTAKTQSTGIKSTRPTQQDDGGNDAPSLTEQGYREGSNVTFMGGTNVKGKRVGSRDIGVIIDVPGGIAKLGGIAGAMMAGITGKYPKDTKFGITIKGDPGKIKYVTPKEYKVLIEDPSAGDEFLNQFAKERSIQDDEGPRGISKDRRIDSKLIDDEKFMKSVADVEKGISRDGFDSFKATAPKVDTSTDTGTYDPTGGQDSGSGDMTTQSGRDSSYGDSGNNESDSGGGGGSSYGDSSGSYGGMGDFNIGGLAGKKKQKTKVKKMKRGGLASR